VGGAPPNCDDGNVCTDDTCDPATGCVNTNNVAACDDGNACTTTDVCDGAGVCAGVNPANTVTVDIAIDALTPESPPGTPSPVTRDVIFVITECGTPNIVTNITQAVTFDSTGFGTANLTGVSTAAGWISVRTGHTLSRLAALTFDPICNDAFVDLTGGNALTSGDFQNSGGTAFQDDLVDIVDFSILASSFDTTIDRTSSLGADATGDGVQGTADFTVLQVNFLKVSDSADGCGTRFAGDPFGDGAATRRPIYRIPDRNLSSSTARAADINQDGVVDVWDIRAFARRHDLRILPEFSDKLDLIEESEHGKRGRASRR
ncbi:MAG: hypothetical protein ACE5E5_02630, partial [Phycisphaerae bacterium]